MVAYFFVVMVTPRCFIWTKYYRHETKLKKSLGMKTKKVIIYLHEHTQIMRMQLLCLPLLNGCHVICALSLMVS